MMAEADELLARVGRPSSSRDAPPPRSHLRIGSAVSGLAVYAVVVLAMTMSPTPLDQGYESAIAKFLGVLHRNGVPEWFGYSKLEFTANIAMFIPLGFLIALALHDAQGRIGQPAADQKADKSYRYVGQEDQRPELGGGERHAHALYQ